MNLEATVKETLRRQSAIFGLAALCVAGAAWGQVARDEGGTAHLQAMIQQMTSERAQLESEARGLRRQLDDTNAELEKLRKENDSFRGQLGQARSSLDQTSTANRRNEQLVEQLRGRMDELVGEFRKTANELRETELDRNRLHMTLETREGELMQCVTNNRELYQIGNEVLDRYEHKGVWKAMREKEPFTQNKRVQLENLVDTYRWKIDDELLPDAQSNAN